MEQRWLNSELFRSDRIILVSDRSLSTAGLRRLQEERIRNSDWPNPGVFTFPQLAKSIVETTFVHHNQIGLPRLLSKLEQLQIILEGRKTLLKSFPGLLPQKHSLQVWKLFQSFNDLQKFPLNPELIFEIVKELESKNPHDPEIREISEALLYYFSLKESCKNTEILSEWDYIPIACRILKESRPLSWIRIFQTSPYNSDPALLVLTYKELFPLEQELLNALELSTKVLKQLPPASTFPPVDLEQFTNQFSYKTLQQSASIFWANTSEKPRPLEAHELLSQMPVSLDLSFSEHNTAIPTLRALNLWLDYHDKNKPQLHPVLKDKKIQSTLNEMSLEIETKPSNEILKNILAKRWPKSSDFIKENKLLLPEFSTPLDLELLIELDLLKDPETDTEIPLNLDCANPTGVPILSLEDFPFFASADHNFFWGDPESLKALLDANSKYNLSRMLFPRDFKDILEREHLMVPNTSHETVPLYQYIKNWEEKCSYLNIQRVQPALIEATPELHEALQPSHLSPTGLEAYYSCSYRYYLDRVLRLTEQTLWDDPKLKATELGTWLHRVLEDFFSKPDFSNPRSQLENLFYKHLSAAFSKSNTSAFLSLIEFSIQRYCNPLLTHILEFEKPLREIVKTQDSQLELSIQSELYGLPLKGTIDRLDRCQDFQLLFDYKTGRYDSKALTLIRDAKFQWFLYRRILKANSAQIIPAGGYLNPIYPERSRLFFFEKDGEKFLSLKNFLNSSKYKTELIDINQEKELNIELDKILNQVGNGLKNKKFLPLPLKNTLCNFCKRTALCGRPYLVLESSDE